MKLKARVSVAILCAGGVMLVYAGFFCARVIEYTHTTDTYADLHGALLRATQSGDIAAMRIFLALGANPNLVSDSSTMPALSVAAQNSDLRAVKLLLKHGANANGYAIVHRINEIPKIQSGHSMDLPPMKIESFLRPLLQAAIRGDSEIVSALRRRGARYEVVDALFLADEPFVRNALANETQWERRFKHFQATWLLMAVEHNNVPAIRLMLDLGFDPAEEPVDGPTPLASARALGREEIVNLFETAIAKSSP